MKELIGQFTMDFVPYYIYKYDNGKVGYTYNYNDCKYFHEMTCYKCEKKDEEQDTQSSQGKEQNTQSLPNKKEEEYHFEDLVGGEDIIILKGFSYYLVCNPGEENPIERYYEESMNKYKQELGYAILFDNDDFNNKHYKQEKENNRISKQFWEFENNDRLREYCDNYLKFVAGKLKSIDEEKLRTYCNLPFNGNGDGHTDRVPELVKLIRSMTCDKDIARLACAIYDKKNKILDRRKRPGTFDEWYENFCLFVKMGYHIDYHPGKLRDEKYNKIQTELDKIIEV